MARARMSADERREAVLEAAMAEFAVTGLHGTSTEAIAARAGISQPYLFRLFATKQELFVAAVRRCLDNTIATFENAAEGLTGEPALQAMGMAYDKLIADRKILLLQLQMYASCDDPEVRDTARDGFRRLWARVRDISGMPPAVITPFFANGMLCNLVVALGLLELDEPWAISLAGHEGMWSDDVKACPDSG